MPQVVFAKRYQFVPPHHGRFWPWVWQKVLPGYTRRQFGVDLSEVHGLERLQASLQSGHGIILAPNHSRPCDAFLVMQMGARLRQPFYTMASAHLFMQGRLQRWWLTSVGAFSVFREGLDREALKMAVQILVEARRPLVVFPEGVITRGNDRLGYVMDGVAFIARSAAKTRVKENPAAQVVVHPVCLRYTFDGDLPQTVGPILDTIEERLGWHPYAGTSLVERIRHLGEALLTVKEVEYFGSARVGSRAERVSLLIDRVLGPLEDLYLSGRREATTVARMKKLRAAILPALTEGTCTADEQATRWRHLDDCSFAQALEAYSRGYIDGSPTVERLLETVERFEEDTTGAARIHRPMRCRIEVGEAIPVTGERPRGEADPLTAQLEERLKAMLADSAQFCHPWKD